MIQVENLVYKYPQNKVTVVKDISFKIDEGEIFGFLGPSGAGKSTTQKILIRILSGYKGSIRINNEDFEKLTRQYYYSIGVCFELPNHYLKLTALENLQFFTTFYNIKKKKLLELLSWVGLEKEANLKVEHFSKGMKMRLNFIRSIAHNPKILFLDEPTSGLDPVNARKIKDIILDQKEQGKTIFITTHNMYDADELCDHVAFIVDGKLEIVDSPKNLKQLAGQRLVCVEYENGKVYSKEFSLLGLAENNEFLELLKNNHIRSIHSKEATLEDIFIKVTGKNLVKNG